MSRYIPVFAIACAFILGITAFARADDNNCAPLAPLHDYAVSKGIPASALITIEGAENAQSYLSELGVPLPDGSSPQGVFIVAPANYPTAFVSIIEPGNCVRFSLIVPAPQHAIALAKVQKGA